QPPRCGAPHARELGDEPRRGRGGGGLRQRRDHVPRIPARAAGEPRRLPASLRGAAARKETSMKIAIALFDRFTALDAVGPYEVLSRLPGAETVFVGCEKRVFRTDLK